MSELAVWITAPTEGQLVPHSVTVRGAIVPSGAEVQVLVLAADGKWYQQKRPRRLGNVWVCDVKVGDPEPHAKEYSIVALAGGQRIPHPNPVDAIPDGFLPTQVGVIRLPV